MIPFYRFLEVAAYSLLIFVPFLFLSVWPFRRHLRFSFPVSNLLVVLLCIFQITSSMLTFHSYFSEQHIFLLRVLVYAAFYFALVDTHPGKLAFTLMALFNIQNLIAVCAKYLESLLFGDLALESYRWSLCLCVLLLQLITVFPLYSYIINQYSRVVRGSYTTWHFLWGVPTTFFVVWYYHLYLATQSSQESFLNIKSILFLVVINLGAFLTCHTEVMLITEKEKAQELAQQNYLLTMQQLQHDNLQQRINEARQARHDIRHHTLLIREYLQSGKLRELEAYLDEYTSTLPDSLSMVYCQHYATNALLGFFARQAKANGIEMDIFVQLPEQIQLPETTLSVVLGNLLENAMEACCQVPSGKKKITVRGKADKGFVFFSITNNFDGNLQKTRSGKFLSTKSGARGFGLDSVGQLVESNGGILEIETKDGLFRASVLLSESPAASDSPG